jgi:predicted nucleic acid-binding protein
MKGWIFNASPLILLGKIHQLHLIEALSPGFRIPRAVIGEIGAGAPDDPAVKWLGATSTFNHIVDAPTAPSFLGQWDLGAGETAVLSVALAEDGATVVLDDLAARKFAQTFRVPLMGTLGILLRARKVGLIDRIAPHIQSLDAAGANLSKLLIAHALHLAGEAP